MRRPTLLLVEPDINPVTRRLGLPIVASYPPLAQVRLAGQIPNADVEIWDLRIPGERRRLLSRARQDPPDVIGISLTFSSNGVEALEVAARLRQTAPKARILLGGSAATEEPGSFTGTPVDLVGFRSADGSLPALMTETARAGAAPERFPGFFHQEGSEWVMDHGCESPPLDTLKPYAWHLLPRRYWRHYYQGLRHTGMGQTSEGCPFNCSFCSVWITHGRRIRMAALDNVRHDLRSLPAVARNYFFADDIWMQGSTSQVETLYDPLLEWVAADFLPRRGDFWFTAETRTDLFLREEARFGEWIRRGGLKRIFFGVEAATDAQLESFHKRNTVDNNSRAIRRAREMGAYVTVQMVIPCDADAAYFDEMVRFIAAHRQWINVTNFTIATPLPGTVLYHEALNDVPELDDRSRITFPAFSLFTALLPTALPLREFYEQVARLYREANQMHFNWDTAWQLTLAAFRTPGGIPRLIRIPGMVSALTRSETFQRIHAEVVPEPGYLPASSAGQLVTSVRGGSTESTSGTTAR